MASVDKDSSISEVIALTDDLKLHNNTQGQTSECEMADTNGHASPHGSPKSVHNHDNPEGAVDLSDPDQVIHMLETVDLSEEDTEVLLQEAYKMNRKLKEMLRRQDYGPSKSTKVTKTKPRKQTEDKPTSYSSSESESASRSGSAFSVKKPLPPITAEKERSIYAIKLKRSKTNVPDVKKSMTESRVYRSHSTVGDVKRDTMVSPKKTKSRNAEARPEWNDRFNYS